MKSSAKHYLAPLLLWVVAVLGGLSCGGDSSGVTTLKVINQSRWRENLAAAADLWNARNPGNKVRLDQLIIGYPQLKNKLITACGAGEPPDLSIIDNVWLAEFALKGHLAKLDELDEKWFKNDYEKDFFKVFKDVEIIAGHLYGVRNQTDMALLWYRKDWLKSEKLEPPSTWAELVAIGRHFKDEKVRKKYGNSQYPLAMPLGQKARETLIYELLPLFWGNGGGVFKNGELALNSAENEQTLNFLKDLVDKYEVVSPEAISFEWNRASQLFATGKAVMAFGGSYEKRLIQEISGWDDDEFFRRTGYTLIPGVPDGQSSTTAGGMCYVVYDKSPKKKLAFEILKLAVLPELLRDFLLKTDQHPPRKSIARALNEEDHPFLARTTPFLYRAKARPGFPEYSRLSDLLQEMIEDVVTGKRSAPAALERTSKRIADIMEDRE